MQSEMTTKLDALVRPSNGVNLMAIQCMEFLLYLFQVGKGERSRVTALTDAEENNVEFDEVAKIHVS